MQPDLGQQNSFLIINTDLPVQSVLDHVHQFKLALLFDWQDIDEGLIENSSFRQLVDDLDDLGAAWRWDVDLLGEPDIAIFQSKKRLVGSHSHLQDSEDRRRCTMSMCTFSLYPINILIRRTCYLHELLGDTLSSSGLQGCFPHGQSYLERKGK